MAAERRPFRITVLAGVNGAGKSSVGGAFLEQAGGAFYNPDLAARAIRDAAPALTADAANALAWQRGRDLLEAAIARRADFNFETTLGGQTIARLLLAAVEAGATLNLWYAGLASVELHLARVAARVRKGGHSIPADVIRKRWTSSQLNLIRLLPAVTNLRVFDNSTERDPDRGHAPAPQLVLSVTDRTIDFPGPDTIAATPDWAKPIVVAAFRLLPPVS